MGLPQQPLPGWNPFIPRCAVETILDEDEQGNPIPLLATGWEWSDDFKSLTLTLQQGIKFHDGTDFNAASVKWGLDSIKESQPAEIAYLETVDVIDNYTVRLNYSQYTSIALNDLYSKAGNAAAISPTAVQTNGSDWAITHAIGTGPFIQESFTRSVGVSYVKNPDYWQEGKPYLDRINWSFQSDPITAGASFQAGEGDVFAGIPTVDAENLAQKNKYVITDVAFSPFGLFSDSSNPASPFNKIEVRQAVSYAIDNETIAASLGHGYWEATNQASFPGNISYNPDIVGYPYNPEKAKELLATAGYPDGFETNIWFQTGAGYENLFTAVQGYLSEVGIKAQLQPISNAKVKEMGQKGWEGGMIAVPPYLATGYPPVKTYINIMSKASTRAISSLHPDEIEDMLSKALAETDQSAYIKDLQEINRLYIDKYCTFTPLVKMSYVAASYPYVKDAEIFTHWREIWNPAGTWLDK
jgi:peptide/nickel transport system substrate-binding protein